MINFGESKYAQFATVWEVEDKETYALVKFSTSRKDKKTDEYLNTSWSFVRFVGNAYNDDLLHMPKQTRIVIKSGGISNEPYIDKEGNKAWSKQPKVVVFAWGYPEGEAASKGSSKRTLDAPPEVEDNELPF